MIINGEKWACETCVKGHRATHCKHKDRPLILIKRKGRPSTQCKRCKELRVVRKLHVKCECEEQTNRLEKKFNGQTTLKSKTKIKELRPLAPKRENADANSLDSPDSLIPSTPPTFNQVTPGVISNNHSMYFHTKNSSQFTANISTYYDASFNFSATLHTTTYPPSQTTSGCYKEKTFPYSPTTSSDGCCSTKKNDNDNNNANSNNSKCCSNKTKSPVMDPVPIPEIPPPSSCCGPPSKNQQGEIIRVVTCRCGDSCACVGCDAHPSRAMKESNKDVYIGFSDAIFNRRLSIADICHKEARAANDRPSSILSEDGTVICGCGCSRNFQECSGCFNELCDSSIH